MPESHFDVVVLGAGASGLLCAFTAANRGRRVLVLEKANKVGKKILMSGGGRCNFTNHVVEAANFISQNPHFCKSALKRYSQWDFISLVERHEIEYEVRSHNQLFCKNSAKEILAMLLTECEHAQVKIETQQEVVTVEVLPETGYKLTIKVGEDFTPLYCQSLVVATGALSIPTLGGSGFGYEIAKQFAVNVVPVRAGLVPFMFSDPLKAICERLSGLALETEVSCNDHMFKENILFTHRGMSGPAMLQISNYWFPGSNLTINLLPNIHAGEWLIRQKDEHPKSSLKNVLARMLAKSLVSELQDLWWSSQAQLTLAEFSNKQLLSIGSLLNQWIVKPANTEGYRTAEVTIGGVDTNDISSKTMEVKHQKGLFFVGEVLDVTGHLGGYNFQWAWSSGHTAGLFV